MISKDTAPTPARWRRWLLPLVALAVAAAVALTALVALASTPLDVAGYLDHSYAGDHNINEPTAVSAESKLWWHDGYWWGVLYSAEDNAFNIHRLDAAAQEWIDTGVLVDERVGVPGGTGGAVRQSRADVLWDAAAGELYIATHRAADAGRYNNNTDHHARLMIYSYADGAWTQEGDPVLINQNITESVVLDKDSTGRLWITFVSQPQGSSDTNDYVYVNASAPNDPTSWGTPFILPVGNERIVDGDDISALLAFEDDGGPKIAVMWSNQRDTFDRFYLAVREDDFAGDADEGWTLEPGLTSAIPYDGDDHINMKRAPNGDLLAVVKTDSTTNGEPLVGVVRRASNGNYSFHEVSPVGSQDTRPVMLIDAVNNSVHVYTVSKTDGGNVCQHTAPLGTLAFTVDNCPPPPPSCEATPPELGLLRVALAPVFMGDNDTICHINNPTTTKQVITAEMGRVVLASDTDDEVYVHNGVDVPTPDPTPTVPGPTPTVPGPTPTTPAPTLDYSLYLPAVRK